MADIRDFDQLPAYSVLKELAEKPYDLASEGALTPERISSCVCQGGGFDLLYATQRIDDAIVDALQDLADQSQAVDRFLQMKKGAVVNSIEGYESENRQVAHTACRDIFNDSPYNNEITDRSQKELAKLKEFLDDLENGRITNSRGEPFTDMIQIGIGGSDLGPRAIYLSLAAHGPRNRRVHFISNVDPDDAASVLDKVDIARTLVNVVSKSGSTLETLTNEELVRDAFVKAGLKPEQHFIAVTGQSSPMDNPARYLRSFYMFDSIGGRYSVTSMVGAVMLGFGLGYDNVIELLRGANSMDVAVEEKKCRKNPALLLALLGIWNHNFLGCETVAILPYSQALSRFTAHLQQCDMESNGKSITRQGRKAVWQTGPIVWGEPGTNGQHAFYQLIHQGTPIVPVEFIGFRKSQHEKDITIKETTSQEKLHANLLAQALALATGQGSVNPNKSFAGNRPSTIIMADKLTPYSMGALMALYEAKIVFQGFMWNINSFDQEGVQLGKVLANRLLDHIIEERNGTDTDESADQTGWALLRAAGLTR